MNREKKPFVKAAGLVIGSMLTLPIVGLGLLAATWHAAAEPVTDPMPSPDGKYALVAQVNRTLTDSSKTLRIDFEVRDAAGHVLDRHKTQAAPESHWNIAWDRQDRIWVNGTEIGSRVWQRGSDDKWRVMPDEQWAALPPPFKD